MWFPPLGFAIMSLRQVFHFAQTFLFSFLPLFLFCSFLFFSLFFYFILFSLFFSFLFFLLLWFPLSFLPFSLPFASFSQYRPSG